VKKGEESEEETPVVPELTEEERVAEQERLKEKYR
jgi:hypothetical protein